MKGDFIHIDKVAPYGQRISSETLPPKSDPALRQIKAGKVIGTISLIDSYRLKETCSSEAEAQSVRMVGHVTIIVNPLVRYCDLKKLTPISRHHRFLSLFQDQSMEVRFSPTGDYGHG